MLTDFRTRTSRDSLRTDLRVKARTGIAARAGAPARVAVAAEPGNGAAAG
jgi:hypothetical protein